MKERRRGTIITIGSAAGRRADPRSPMPYAAAKAWPWPCSPSRSPPRPARSASASTASPRRPSSPKATSSWIPADVQAALADMHPLKRLGTPQDVAAAAAFLASAESSWLTGIILDIACGAVLV